MNEKQSISVDNFLNSIRVIKNYTTKTFSQQESYQKKKIGYMQKPPPENDYWKNYLTQRYFYDFSKEDAENILDTRIKFIKNYFENFFNNHLTEKDLNKPKARHYRGPYLPTPQEFECITNLNTILIDWDVPENQLTLRNVKILKKSNSLHREKILHRWKLFQKEYKIYDLRPLIGERCGLIYDSIDDENKLDFVFYQFFNKNQLKIFLMYLGKDTPELNLWQINKMAASICDLYEDGKLCMNDYKNDFLSGLEYRLMYEICDRYGDEPLMFRYMALLIGKRAFHKYGHINRVFIYFRSIPFWDGKWTRAESLRLLRIVKEFSAAGDLKTLMTSKEKLPWRKIFYKFKSRRSILIREHFYSLRQRVLDSMTKRNGGKETKLIWREEQTVKLIELIYETDAKSIRDIDWHEMAKNFPGHTSLFLSTIFRTLANSRVPPSKRKYYEDLIEYLYHKIKPIYQLNDIKRKERKNEVKLLMGIESAFNNDEIEQLTTALWQEDNDLIISGNSEASNPATTTIDQNSNTENASTKRNGLSIYIKEEEFIWQEIMKMHNFKCNYSKDLRKKLGCFIERDNWGETERLERPSTPCSVNISLNVTSNHKAKSRSKGTVKFSRNSGNLKEKIRNSDDSPQISRNVEDSQGCSRNSEDTIDISTSFSEEEIIERKKKGRSKRLKSNRIYKEDFSRNSENIINISTSSSEVEFKESKKKVKRFKHEFNEEEWKEEMFIDNILLASEEEIEEIVDADFDAEAKRHKRRKMKRKKIKDKQVSTNVIDYILEQDAEFLECVAIQKKSEHGCKHQKTSKQIENHMKYKHCDFYVNSLKIEDETPAENIKKKRKKLKKSHEPDLVNTEQEEHWENKQLTNTVDETPAENIKKKRKKLKKSHEPDLMNTEQEHWENKQLTNTVVDLISTPDTRPDLKCSPKKKVKKIYEYKEQNLNCDNEKLNCSEFEILGTSRNELRENLVSKKHKKNKKRKQNVDFNEQHFNTVDYIDPTVINPQTIKKNKHKKYPNKDNNLNDRPNDLKTDYDDQTGCIVGNCVLDSTVKECSESSPAKKQRKRKRNIECDIREEIIDPNAHDCSNGTVKKHKKKRKRDDDI